MAVRRTNAVIAALVLLCVGVPAGAAAQTATPEAQQAACNANDALSCTTLGIRLTDGVGIAKDERRGADLFLRACNLGNAQACMLRGYALDTGRGSYVNLPQASAYYKKSCELGNSIGCNNQGLFFRNGRGEVKNEVLALGFFAKSCGLGFSIGCLNEGVLHADATTFRSNRTLAVAAFEKGCALGDFDSCNKLAWHAEKGMGTSRNVSRAAQLYAKACLGGYELACRNQQLLMGKLPVPVAAAAGSAAVATALPNPAIGPMVCSAFMAERNKLFLAWGFSAAGSRSTELALAYAQMLREQRYAAASMYAPAGAPPPELTVDCRWHAAQAQADEFKDKLIAGAERNRITYVPTTFKPI